MDFLELFLESLGTLTVNKMRTGLAILGIVIGIGSVIALISLGQASQQAIASQIRSLLGGLPLKDDVLLAGGGARSPCLRSLLCEGLQRPVHLAVQPQLVAALGCALATAD